MIKYLLLIYIFFGTYVLNSLKSNEISENVTSSILKWQIKKSNKEDNKLKWNQADLDFYNKDFEFETISSNLKIKAIGTAITVNGQYYPSISNYVNNAFIQDEFKNINLSFRGISKTRHCPDNNFSEKCRDGVMDIDFNLFKLEDFSFNIKYNLQSLTDRGTSFGEGGSFGFKSAFALSENLYMAIGGENIIHMDDTVDLGRNFYILFSKFTALNNKENPSLLIVNAGIGSDFYGYKGNGYLGRTSCFGKPNLTGDGTNNCNWGPIGSIAYAFNDRIAIVNEWFGYGYGSGISLRPLKNSSMNISLFATDYIEGFPSYINESCNNSCGTRFYGGISFNF